MQINFSLLDLELVLLQLTSLMIIFYIQKLYQCVVLVSYNQQEIEDHIY